MRSFDRSDHEARPIGFELDYTSNADGSVLVSYGDTKVICTAFLEERVPFFLKNSGSGWITAEYGMLPGSTHTRSQREAAKGRPSGRTYEIQRLIGRSLRTCVRLDDLGERTITLDCDVIQADGGTRTASISGSYIALSLCLWKYRRKFIQSPIQSSVAAVSLGLREGGRLLVDLDYEEDSSTDVDLNLVMAHDGRLVEVQGTAEGAPFSPEDLSAMVKHGGACIETICKKQREALAKYGLDESWIP